MQSVFLRQNKWFFMNKYSRQYYNLLYIKLAFLLLNIGRLIMFQKLLKMRYVINRLNNLEKYQVILNQCADYLIKNKYSYGSIRHYRGAIEHFLYWHVRENAQCKINNELVEFFLKKHIPICKCSIPAPKRIIDLRRALYLLLKINNCNVENAIDQQNISEKDKLINEFDKYLLDICGLSENTRNYHRRNAKTFLNHFFKGEHVNLSKLTPFNIRNFLYKNLNRYKKRRTLGLFIYTLRCFFKYLQFRGFIGDQLILALPSIREYKRSALPEYLNNEEIKKLISTFDLSTALGKRDYALIVCILEIGLRAHEVANLTLDDINWRDMTLILPRSKTRQSYILPMTITLRDALIAYLKNGRPQTTTRKIFVYHRAPVGKEIKPKVVTEVIRRALVRSQLKPNSAGAHILRKTFATKLLHSGATIKEIADLLRHQSIETTSIYTKVDFSKLIQVALPWPGRDL